ncbi:MAG: hypothetical protein HFJ35_05325 [Clostridia bacterium]|nr:hypothetical protein [Clostridia bacterium]
MKNIKRITYVILFVIVLVLSLTIYTNASKNSEKDQKDKVFSQIKYMEGKIANLLNSMNHVEVRNYSVVTSEMSKATTEKSKSQNSSSSSSSEGGGSSEKSGNASGEQENSEDSSEGATSGEEEKEEKFEMKATGVLTNTEDINWDIIKNEIENIYTSLPSITMDLYQQNISQEDVLGFNTEFDKLTSVAKEEKKEETLTELTKVYEYFPKFLKGSGQEALYTTLVETKWSVFKGYSKLDTGNWQEISKDIKDAIDTYSKLLTNTEIDEKKQYSVSKVYIMINELQNAVNLNDSAVFLIKYKNLLEEMNNI